MDTCDHTHLNVKTEIYRAKEEGSNQVETQIHLNIYCSICGIKFEVDGGSIQQDKMKTLAIPIKPSSQSQDLPS